MKRILVICVNLVPLLSCGFTERSVFDEHIPTGSPPVVMRITPDSGPVGTEVTIYGLGFSVLFNENIVSLGDKSTRAFSYDLADDGEVGEVEKIMFTVPDGLAAGEHAIILYVIIEPSNGDKIFTVTS